MKRPQTAGKIAAGLSAVLAALAVMGAGSNAPEAKADAKTNNVADAFPTNFPLALFDVNATPVKDPFFPLSTRSAVPVQTVTNTAPTQMKADCFVLNGLSVSADGSALVIINGHTYAEGESFEVTPLCSPSKVKLTVTKIKQYSALVRVEGFMDGLELMLPETAR